MGKVGKRRARPTSTPGEKSARASSAPARKKAGAPEPPRGERAEGPGGLPSSYGEDALVVLPRDPHSLFVYWDHAEATLREAFRDLDDDGGGVELRVYARAGEGWEPVHRAELALESRGYYVHGLDAGRTYRAELRVVDRAGHERRFGPASTAVELPADGPSPTVDDLFVRLPWDQPLGPPVGPGWRRGELPPEARDELARLSSWGDGEAGHGALRPSSPGGPGGEGEGERQA